MSFILKGVDAMNRKLGRIKFNFTDDTASALFIEVEGIAGQAKEVWAPVDKGPLRSSIHATRPVRKLFRVMASVVAGGPAKAYALAVHETPSEHDPPSWRGKAVNFIRGGPKYIWIPMMKALPGMAERIARRVKFRL